MPSIAKSLAPALIVGLSAISLAQSPSPAMPQPGWPAPANARPEAGFLPPGESRPGSVVPAAFQQPLPAEATTKSSRLLPPPGRSERSPAGSSPDAPTSMLTVVASLATVLGLFLLAAWGLRRLAPAAMIALPGEVFEVLGRAPLGSRQQVHLLRCGKKLLLVSVTATGAQTLTEVTDPPEVDRLSGLCQQARPNSATATFRQVLGQLGGGQAAELRQVRQLEELRAGGRRNTPADQTLENRHV